MRGNTLKVPGTALTISAVLLPRRQAAVSTAVSQPAALATRRPVSFSSSARVLSSQPDGTLLSMATPCTSPRVSGDVINAQVLPPPAEVPKRKTRDASPPNAEILRLIHC